jgi:UDP-N-acetylmuramoyl-L-alanyl-D-glutamate--2,6-diaminopimelate ligase
MITIAVTGSKGKTTTVKLISHILRHFGRSVLDSGTLGIYRDGKKISDATCAPHSMKMDEDFFVFEAYAPTIKHSEFKPDIAVYTNIEHNEHGETYAKFEDYLRDKRGLISGLLEEQVAIVNADDSYVKEIVRGCKAEVFTVSMRSCADFRFSIGDMDDKLMHIGVNGTWMTSKLLGEHNAYNIITAVAACTKAIGGWLEEFSAPVLEFSSPDMRFERYQAGGNILVADFAHTVNSLRCTLDTIRRVYPGKQVVTVFGCSGERDKSKRPLMGKVACELSDEVIVTEDGSKSETLRSIISDILGGCTGGTPSIRDRREAIKLAIDSHADSVILVALDNAVEIRDLMGEKMQ